jgi:acyl carrier protein
MAECTLEQSASILAEILGIDAVDVDTPLTDLGVDSLSMLEWVFEVVERLDIEENIEQDPLLDGAVFKTVRVLHEALGAKVGPTQPAP